MLRLCIWAFLHAGDGGEVICGFLLPMPLKVPSPLGKPIFYDFFNIKLVLDSLKTVARNSNRHQLASAATLGWGEAIEQSCLCVNAVGKTLSLAIQISTSDSLYRVTEGGFDFLTKAKAKILWKIFLTFMENWRRLRFHIHWLILDDSIVWGHVFENFIRKTSDWPHIEFGTSFLNHTFPLFPLPLRPSPSP